MGEIPLPPKQQGKVSSGEVPTQHKETWSDGQERVEAFSCAGEGSRERVLQRVLHGDVPSPAQWGEDSSVPWAGPALIHLPAAPGAAEGAALCFTLLAWAACPLHR